MVNLLPYHSFELITNLSSAEVIEKIIYNTITKKKLHFKQYKKLFRGIVTEKGFNISREVNYRNSFKAHITGEIYTLTEETEVKVTMKLHPFASVFLTLWCSIVSLAFVIILIAGIYNTKILLGCFFPLIMLIFGYGLAKLSFNYDARETQKILIDILKAKN